MWFEGTSIKSVTYHNCGLTTIRKVMVNLQSVLCFPCQRETAYSTFARKDMKFLIFIDLIRGVDACDGSRFDSAAHHT